MLSARSQPSADTALKASMHDLSRLLSRLQRQVLATSPSTDEHVGGDADLRTSVYLRRKTGANVEYARALLLRLERDVAAVKVASRRTAWTAELRAHRDLVAQLNRALIELDQLDDGNFSSDDDVPEPPTTSAPTSTPAPPAATLRSRNPGASQGLDSAQSTALFSGRSPTTTTAAKSSLKSREEVLTSQAAEQEHIKSSLLSLAVALKESNVDFGRSLDEEKSVLDRAVKGLDRNALGMEGAERKMGALRKMTEGQGWYGRIKLYALIAALWVAAFLLVFVGPKLRF